MKHCYTFLLILLFASPSFSQQFLWANSYDISNCNEVAAIAADTNGNIFITGVYDAPVFLPYMGDAYISRTDPDGEELWTEYFTGDMHISDITTLDESAVIVGQSNGPFSYMDVSYGPEGYFFFMLKLDGDGTLQWEIFDETLYGVNASVERGGADTLVVYSRGQYNVGDWILIHDADGELLDSRLLSTTATMIVDMAYHNERIYLNGIVFSPSSVVIDTVFIQVPPFESGTFVLALNDELVALWVSVDTAINNNDGKIVANDNGIYSYSQVLTPPFNIVNMLKRFNEEGQLLNEVEVPLFSNAVSHYPDMAITSDLLGLFVNNAFDFDSHKVLVYNDDLTLDSEFIIDGTSDLYSGKITEFEEDFMIAHVYSDDLNFNDELTLYYSGTGKNPYIARIGDPTFTGSYTMEGKEKILEVYPNPAEKFLHISTSNLISSSSYIRIIDMNGQEKLKTKYSSPHITLDISRLKPGVYFVILTSVDGRMENQRVIVQ